MMPLVQVEKICHAFDRKSVLQDITFQIQPGEGVVVLGPNGAGKTTLLLVLSGLLSPVSGKITPSGLKKSLFWEDRFFYQELTLWENLKFHNELIGKNSSRLEQLIDFFSLGLCLAQPIHTLSKGEKIRGALCRTFLWEAPLYLLDEPFSGLDEKSASLLVQYLDDLTRKGDSFIIATHETDLLQGSLYQRLFLSCGRLIP